MKELKFKAAYRQMRNDHNGFDESNFIRAEMDLSIKPKETAFIMIDVWDCSETREKFGYVTSLTDGILERFDRITKENVKPALEAARTAGLTIIHAPTSYISNRMPEYAEVKEKYGVVKGEPSNWPPKEFRSSWNKTLYEAKYGTGAGEVDAFRKKTSTVHPAVKPIEGEFVIAQSHQVQGICKDRGILNIIYAGFAANMCLLFKNGGIVDMVSKGYRVIVLEDCLSAIESSRTYADLSTTQTMIEFYQMAWGVTAPSKNYIAACNAES